MKHTDVITKWSTFRMLVNYSVKLCPLWFLTTLHIHVYLLGPLISDDIAPVTALDTRPKTVVTFECDILHCLSWTVARLDKFGKITHEFEIFREQEWRSGESTRLPPMWPGVRILASTPLCGLSLLLVLSLVSRGFSPGTPVFPSP